LCEDAGDCQWEGEPGNDQGNEPLDGGRITSMTALNYEIRVEGVVPSDVLAEIDGVRAAIQPLGTILRGTVVDQAALHGVINRLQGLGLELVEVRRLLAGAADTAHENNG
jgi:hypothetical protein